MIKIEKSNNPAAVGALVLVLVLIVGRIFWMVFGHTEAASAASPAPTPAPTPNVSSASAAPPSAAAAPVPPAKPYPSAAVPISTRNPFAAVTRPVPVPTHAGDLPPLSGGAHRVVARGGDTALGALPPMPFRVAPIADKGQAQSVTATRSLGLLPLSANSAGKQPEQTPDLKLTAIIDGAEPMALVQTSNPQPVTLHVGDLIEGMRVTAIHEQDIVFARGTGCWTLSLQSAADSALTGQASVTTAAPDAAPAISVVTPEDNTDEKH